VLKLVILKRKGSGYRRGLTVIDFIMERKVDEMMMLQPQQVQASIIVPRARTSIECSSVPCLCHMVSNEAMGKHMDRRHTKGHFLSQ
jgi:hypothetical protein